MLLSETSWSKATLNGPPVAHHLCFKRSGARKLLPAGLH
jgi:hypothetical protein